MLEYIMQYKLSWYATGAIIYSIKASRILFWIIGHFVNWNGHQHATVCHRHNCSAELELSNENAF